MKSHLIEMSTLRNRKTRKPARVIKQKKWSTKPRKISLMLKERNKKDKKRNSKM